MAPPEPAACQQVLFVRYITPRRSHPLPLWPEEIDSASVHNGRSRCSSRIISPAGIERFIRSARCHRKRRGAVKQDRSAALSLNPRLAKRSLKAKDVLLPLGSSSCIFTSIGRLMVGRCQAHKNQNLVEENHHFCRRRVFFF